MDQHFDIVRWMSPNVPPEYQFHVAGKKVAVNILIAMDSGSIWDGEYSDGDWYAMGIRLNQCKIVAWCHYPAHPTIKIIRRESPSEYRQNGEI